MRFSHYLSLSILLASACTVPPSAKPKPDAPHAAAHYRLLRYRDENGRIPARAWQTALEQRAQVAAASALVPTSGGIAPPAWVSRGPNNVAGRSRSLVIDPRDPQRMFCGAVAGGLWRSTNAGATWSPIDDWWSNLAVSAVEIDPQNPDVMYVGTGEGFYSLAHLDRSFNHFVRGAGMLKSIDGGSTWTHLPTTAAWQAITRIAVHPSNSQILLCSRRPGGIARSSDGGQSWVDVLSGELSFQVAFDPNDGNRAIAHFSSTGPLVHGVVTSTDAGITWQPAQSGLTSLAGENARIELHYARSVANLVFASVGVNGGTIWRSTDGGRNWSQRTTSGATGASRYYDPLWVSPTDPAHMVAGGVHTFRSTDGGVSVSQISDGYILTVEPHPDIHYAIHDPNYDGTTNRRVWLTTDGGVHVADDVLTASTSGGWRHLDTDMISTQFYGAAGNGPTDTIVGGTQDNGTLRVVGNSRTANLNYGGDGGQVQIDPTNANYVFGEIQWLGVHRSTNGGASARSITTGLSEANSSGANFIAPLRLDPNQSRRLYGGGLRLWRTTDARASNVGWTAVKPSNGSFIAAIAVAPGNSDRVLVGHNDGRLYRSTNATVSSPSWVAIDDNGASNPLPDRVVTRLVFDPSDAQRVYACFGGFSTDNLWRSTDGGVTWQPITGSGALRLPTAPVYCVAVHPDHGDVLYAATEVGVFASNDGGTTWTTSNDGPANVVCEEIVFMHGSRRLLLATLGRGLWTADVVLPSVSSFGSACGGSSMPNLGVALGSAPRIGRVLHIEVPGLDPNAAFALLFLGLSDTQWNGTPLPLSLGVVGMPNCQLFVSIDGSLPGAISTAGVASWALTLPADPALLGAAAFFQSSVADPAANALGLAMSQGLRVVLGW
ncbi:MAG: hypothetical protein AB7I19_10840 [Planctomycetota bacterium]